MVLINSITSAKWIWAPRSTWFLKLNQYMKLCSYCKINLISILQLKRDYFTSFNVWSCDYKVYIPQIIVSDITLFNHHHNLSFFCHLWGLQLIWGHGFRSVHKLSHLFLYSPKSQITHAAQGTWQFFTTHNTLYPKILNKENLPDEIPYGVKKGASFRI